MKNICLIFLLMPSIACGQNIKWHDVNVNDKSEYKIKNEGEIINTLFDVPETEGTIKSDLIVNNDTLKRIQFVKTFLKDDTLRILIYQTDASYPHAYIIEIYGDKYLVNYDFRTSGEQEKLKWKTMSSTPKLNNRNFQKGNEIRGYTEYTGRCIRGCENNEIITVKGNFSTLIE